MRRNKVTGGGFGGDPGLKVAQELAQKTLQGSADMRLWIIQRREGERERAKAFLRPGVDVFHRFSAIFIDLGLESTGISRVLKGFQAFSRCLRRSLGRFTCSCGAMSR